MPKANIISKIKALATGIWRIVFALDPRCTAVNATWSNPKFWLASMRLKNPVFKQKNLKTRRCIKPCYLPHPETCLICSTLLRILINWIFEGEMSTKKLILGLNSPTHQGPILNIPSTKILRNEANFRSQSSVKWCPDGWVPLEANICGLNNVQSVWRFGFLWAYKGLHIGR